MNPIFDINRAWNLTLLKLNLNRKSILIALAGYLGLVFIITYFMAGHLEAYNASSMNQFHLISMIILVFAGAVWVSGRSYQDMNTSEKSISQLMLPASRFEKFIVPLLFSSVVWIIGVVLFYTFYVYILNGIWGMIYGIDFGNFNPLAFNENQHLNEFVQAFFVTHSIFFLGGLSFKTYPISKTILAGFIINTTFSVLFMIVASILFQGDNGVFINDQALKLYFEEHMTVENIESLTRWVKFVFAFIIPAILYVTAYYKLKEREV